MTVGRGGRLTSHVLDVAHGRPAAGVRIDLAVIETGGGARLLATATTNADGRTSAPLLAGDAMAVGAYELTCGSPSLIPKRTTTCRCSSRPGATAPIAGAERGALDAGLRSVFSFVHMEAAEPAWTRRT
jgi:hypothetical protein